MFHFPTIPLENFHYTSQPPKFLREHVESEISGFFNIFTFYGVLSSTLI